MWSAIVSRYNYFNRHVISSYYGSQYVCTTHSQIVKREVIGFRSRAFDAFLFLGCGVASFRDLCPTFRHSVVVPSPIVECLHCTFEHWYFDTWICHSGADEYSGLPRYGTVSSSKYRGADKSLAWPTSRCILFDGENISFDASLVIYINSNNIPPIMIINKIYEHQNLLSL